jgi:hypothetical protein
MAILLALVCLVVAVGVFMPPVVTQFTVVLAVSVFALIWVAVQDLGGILAGGATDPNAAPLVILIALLYWPLIATGTDVASDDGDRSPVTAEA